MKIMAKESKPSKVNNPVLTAAGDHVDSSTYCGTAVLQCVLRRSVAMEILHVCARPAPTPPPIHT